MALVAALLLLPAFSACGDGSSDEEATGGGSGATGRGGGDRGGTTSRGGTASRGGSASGGEPSGEAGAPAGEAGEGSGGTTSGAAGSTSSGEGGSPSSAEGGAAGAGDIQVPGPAPGGGSVYAVECSGDTAMCGTEHAHCLQLTLPEDQVGYACSNHCETVADCSDEPTGAEAQVGCVMFTMQSRCMLICEDQGTEYGCPDGMSCYVYPNATFGYCLWGL